MDGFRADCEQIENTLSAPAETSFPVQVEGQSFDIWSGQQLPDRYLGFDTETEPIQGRKVPVLALAMAAGSSGSCVFIHAADLPSFVQKHSQALWMCHNWAFDFWVVAKALRSHGAALDAWWSITGQGQAACTMLWDCLIQIAKKDAFPVPRKLSALAAEVGLALDKDDPFRLRFGELIGLPVEAWPQQEPGFFQYAALDALATLRVGQALLRKSKDLIRPYKAQLLDKAVPRFGPLTVAVQTQAAVALEHVGRVGVCVDLEKTEQLHGAIEEVLSEQMQVLESLSGESIFKRYGPRSKKAGQFQVTPSGVVRKDAKRVKARLEAIAKASNEGLRPRRNKDGLVTDAVSYWKQHTAIDPFVESYVRFSEMAKLCQFFKKLDQKRIYPRYTVLVRTGRTSCASPNVQQIPRDPRFRELIVPRPGYLLLQSDYSAIELRTLAQICLARYGSSKLADLFREGTDPHCYTAALLMGLTLDEFNALPSDKQKQARQRAKAVNFGVPGGLGASSLVGYAKSAYGVDLSIDEARDFRKRLCTQTYPELNDYLQHQSIEAIASNLHTTQKAVREAFGHRDQLRHAGRIIAGETETEDEDRYTQKVIDRVWTFLDKLNANPKLAQQIAAREGSNLLMRRVFYDSCCTITGRVRGHVSFTQLMNSPFSGLAADGAKLAMFRMLQAGHEVIGFVHDEFLIHIREGTDYAKAVADVEAIMISSMQEVVPDVPIDVESLLGDRWYKGDAQHSVNAQGKIIPYRKRPEIPVLDYGQQQRAAKHQKEHEGNAMPF